MHNGHICLVTTVLYSTILDEDEDLPARTINKPCKVVYDKGWIKQSGKQVLCES